MGNQERTMKIGDTIKIKALSGASQRTKNRIRERGADGFTVEKEPQSVRFDNPRGVNWVMVMSADGNWSGWLPVDEIEVVA
tara:strand:- start:239 stop:481 length:243 start_codon:yes stop_codon:yes gene_type:complete